MRFSAVFRYGESYGTVRCGFGDRKFYGVFLCGFENRKCYGAVRCFHVSYGAVRCCDASYGAVWRGSSLNNFSHGAIPIPVGKTVQKSA